LAYFFKVLIVKDGFFCEENQWFPDACSRKWSHNTLAPEKQSEKQKTF